MAGHRIEMTVDGAELLNKDVVFHAHKTEKEGSEVIGRLLVSKGGVKWLPKNHHVNGVEFNWSKFAELMEKEM
jgi:hypothetical protein